MRKEENQIISDVTAQPHLAQDVDHLANSLRHSGGSRSTRQTRFQNENGSPETMRVACGGGGGGGGSDSGRCRACSSVRYREVRLVFSCQKQIRPGFTS